MILSDVLGSEVVDADGARVGFLVDARFRLEGRRATPTARLTGFIVSPHSRAPFLGYERTGFDRPRVIAAIVQRIHRGTFLVAWEDVARIDADRVTLRPGFERADPAL